MIKNQLLHEIERKREELIEVVAKFGVISTIALQYSTELDHLLNQYEQIEKHKLNHYLPNESVISQ